MPRPLKVDRPHKKTVSLPESIVARVDLLLYSETEARVPQSAWQNYLTNLIRKDLIARGIKL